MRKSVIVAAFAALGTCVSTVAPAIGAPSAAAVPPVRTVFIGDSYTANFGIAPTTGPSGCFRAVENYPALATEHLDREGVPLDVQADVSCGAAEIHHVWEPQELLGDAVVEPQKDALRPDTQLVVGSLGGNTVGFAPMMKQCSKQLRGLAGALLPVNPVDPDSPAADCADFFENGDGAAWLKERFATVKNDLRRMFAEIREQSPGSETVLVGYPRIIPEDTTKCLTAIPGGFRKPLADINQDALKFLDKKVQKPLNDLMNREAQAAGATFVNIYDQSSTHTACDGEQRGIGAMLEPSEARLGPLLPLPWFVHPNRTGRDLQADLVTKTVKDLVTA
ncbi:SGNH/GDSL hydrolase family protein (plasmid) [Streptomyces sp. NBC_00257]|uniref:SGNH/GDSL hydrolase family protein n=1 Tax=unclassified Streptomyces TaxID=2593676 RepID=UPI0022526B97|nr:MULTISPECIES: SGNH/GDSL hydrolase family protein [unclassified Streptomyces]MCX5434009.1 SGNH/GDSL hydrolase family protein [Streptomyces sp. NBC_00062]MCX5434501.1 SGNH/GDSL hydrolase family protein [Streptomyces sp. NBC_00062]